MFENIQFVTRKSSYPEIFYKDVHFEPHWVIPNAAFIFYMTWICVVCRSEKCAILNMFQIGTVQKLSHIEARQQYVLLSGYSTPGSYFWRLCAFFFQKWSNFEQSILWIWSEMFKRTQKLKFYFSRDHSCEVTVKMCENQYFPCFEP